jgi:hypothetical protein
MADGRNTDPAQDSSYNPVQTPLLNDGTQQTRPLFLAIPSKESAFPNSESGSYISPFDVPLASVHDHVTQRGRCSRYDDDWPYPRR